MRATATIGLALFVAAGTALAGGAPLERAKEIPLPGRGGFDLLFADAAARRLYVAHSTKVDVIDLDRAERVGAVEGLEGVHQAIVVPGLARGFATESKRKRLAAFDAKTLALLKEVETGEGPDAVLYVATTKEVWAINHAAGTITCVDPESYAVKATIEVGGTLELAAEQPSKGLVFVNVEDEGVVAAIDAAKHTVKARYPLDPATKPTGIALDEKNGVLFCGCDGKMAMLDAATGKLLTTLPIGEHCDGAAFDAEARLAYASCGDGTLAVIHEVEPASFEIVTSIPTVPGARTCAFDSKTRALWLGAGTRGKDDARVLQFAPVAPK